MVNNQAEQSENDSNNPSSNPEGWDSTKEKYNKGHVVIPYKQGLGDSIKKICKRYGIQTHFKGNKTIKNILVKPKDKDPLDRKSRPSTGTSVGCSFVMRNILERHPGPLGRYIKST